MEQNEALAENELEIVQDGDNDFYIMHNGRAYALKTENDSGDLTRMNQERLVDRGVFEEHNFENLPFYETQDLFSKETEKTMYIVEINTETKEEISETQSVSAQLFGGNIALISKSELLKGIQTVKKKRERPYVYNVTNKNEEAEALQIPLLYRDQPFTPFEQTDNKDKSLVDEKQETEREEETKNYGFYLYIVNGTNLKQLKQEDVSKRTKDTIYLKEESATVEDDGYLLSIYPDLKEIDSSTLEEIKNGNILGKPQETKYGIVINTVLSGIIPINYQVRNELRNFAAKSDTAQVDEELEEEKRLEEKRRSKKIEEKEGRGQEEKRKQEEEEKRKEEQQRKKEEELKTVFFSDENMSDKEKKMCLKTLVGESKTEYYVLSENGLRMGLFAKSGCKVKVNSFPYDEPLYLVPVSEFRKGAGKENIKGKNVIELEPINGIVDFNSIEKGLEEKKKKGQAKEIAEEVAKLVQQKEEERREEEAKRKAEEEERRRKEEEQRKKEEAERKAKEEEERRRVEEERKRKEEEARRKAGEEVKPSGFFTESANIINRYRLKFTDGTDEYYILTECGDFNYQREEIIKEEAEELAVVDTNTFCYLVPSDVISRTFPDGNIPEHLSREDIDKINKSDDIIKFESDKKRQNYVFTVFESKKCIETIDDKKKEPEAKTTIKPIKFFTDPDAVKLDKKGTNGYRLKFTDGTDEYYVFDRRRKDFYFHDKELEAGIFETPRDTKLYLVPSDVISRTFPDGNIPEHLSREDANKIENSKGNIELRYNHIFGWKKTIRAIKAQKERQKEKEETVQFENGEVQLTENTLTWEDIEKKKRQEEEQAPTIQQLMQEDLEWKKRKEMFCNMVQNSYLREDAEKKKRKEEQRKKEEEEKRQTEEARRQAEEEERKKQKEEEKKEKLKRLKIVPQGLLKSEFCIELDGKEYILRIEEKGKELRRMSQKDIKGDRMYNKTAFPESGLTLATEGKKTIFISEKTKDEKSGFSGRILASGNITNISGEQLIEKIQGIQEDIEKKKRQEDIAKATQQKEEELKSKTSKSLSAFSDVNKGKEADNSSIASSIKLEQKKNKGR